MPLHHGRTAKGIRASIGKNIRLERHHGRSMKQSIAIAFSTAKKDAKKAHTRVAGVTYRRKRHR